MAATGNIRQPAYDCGSVKALQSTFKQEQKMDETNQDKLYQDPFMSQISSGVSMIDFNAAWCSPCREQQPIVDRLVQKFKGRATILGLDVDQNPGPAQSMEITSIPTLIIYKDGKEIQRFIGKQSEETLANSLRNALDG
jgi:thioredoxin 1